MHAGKPGSTSVPEAMDIGDDSITLMWKPPAFNGGGEIINYIIEYAEKSSKKWIVSNKGVNVTETSYQVTKLTHDALYRFRITAVNVASPGDPSTESMAFRIARPAIPEAPVIKEPLKDVTAAPKENVTLACIIVGVPQPILTWYKDDVEIGMPSGATYEAGKVRLVLSAVTEDSAGCYSVAAYNDSGRCETTCTLLVRQAPIIAPEKKAKVQRVRVEQPCSISAKVGGLPRPDVVWTKNGEPIEDSHYIIDVEVLSSTLCTTTLSIVSTERTDTAKYTLTATNVAGTTTHDVTLKISGRLHYT